MDEWRIDNGETKLALFMNVFFVTGSGAWGSILASHNWAVVLNSAVIPVSLKTIVNKQNVTRAIENLN
jgi:hypothetical protein